MGFPGKITHILYYFLKKTVEKLMRNVTLKNGMIVISAHIDIRPGDCLSSMLRGSTCLTLPPPNVWCIVFDLAQAGAVMHF